MTTGARKTTSNKKFRKSSVQDFTPRVKGKIGLALGLGLGINRIRATMRAMVKV